MRRIGITTMMRVLVLCLALMAAASASFGIDWYLNDCSSLTDWSTRTPLGAPYLSYGGTAVSTDTPSGSSGYMVLDLPFTGFAEPVNVSGGKISLTWRFDYTGIVVPPPSGPIGLWLRVYSGTQNPDTKVWTMVARAGYFFEANIGEGWTTQTAAISAPGDLYGGVPLDPTNVYKFRYDVVYWDGNYSPNTISIDDFRVTGVGRLVGLVKDTRGNVVSGATVSLSGGGPTGTTLADGTYAIEAIDPGTYDVTVTSPLCVTQTHTGIGIVARQTTTENFTVVPTYGYIYGTVVDGSGKPVPQAIVGIKSSAKATADAQTYLLADNAGKFTKQAGNGTHYVGAWTYGWLASADVSVTVAGDDHTITVPITTKAGADIAIGGTASATSEDPGNPAGNAIDGSYGSRWITANPLPETEQDQTYTIDLGSVKDVAGLTIWWENAFPSDYTVDVTTGDPATGPWTNVYTVTGATGGWATGYGQNIDPINLASVVPARGIRFHMTKYRGANIAQCYSAWEFVVHGTSPDPNVYSRISDLKTLTDGTPVDVWKEVSASGMPNDRGDSTIYPDYFWYEEYDRTAGIRVHKAGHGAWVGELDRTIGTMATDPTTGERYIEGTEIQWLGYLGTKFAPVAITNKTAASSKLPVGLIVTTWGKVTGVDPDRNWFTISDGSGTDVKVFRPATRADIGAFVTVTGVLGAEPAIYEPVINFGITSWLFNGSYSTADPDPEAPMGEPTDPLPNKWHTWQGINLSTDFLASAGGEVNIVPKAGDLAPNGGEWFVWSKDNGEFDLTSMPWVTSGQNMRLEYASAWFYSPGTYKYSTDDLTAWVASDDGYKIWVNGVVAGENNIWRGLTMDPLDELQAGDPWSGEDIWTINPGWNHVMIKINDILGGHAFFVKFTVTDANGTVVPLSLPASVSSW